MNSIPKSIPVTLILISLNAAFWLAYALVLAFGGLHAFGVFPVLRLVFTLLAVGGSTALFGTAFMLRKQNRYAYYFTVFILTALAVLSITDELGWADITSMLVNLVTLGLLIKDRGWYLHHLQV